MTQLRLNRTHYPVTVLGPGVRAGIWVQGCTIGCSGCVARDTWDAGGGAAVDVEAVLDWLRGLDGPVDGVTVVPLVTAVPDPAVRCGAAAMRRGDRSGDMDRLTEHLADAGVLLEDLTWQA